MPFDGTQRPPATFTTQISWSHSHSSLPMRHPCPILKMRASTASPRTASYMRRSASSAWSPGPRSPSSPHEIYEPTPRSRRPLPVRTLGANGLCIHEVAPRSRADGDVVDGGRHGSRRLGAQASHAGWNKRLQTHIQYVWGNLVVGLPARSAGNFRILWAQFAGFRRGAPTFFGWAFYLLCFW